jgi:electron transport complex protein RnfB
MMDATALLADRLNDLLPQTQCTKCGHDGCRPYAEAIAAGAPINPVPA